MTKRKGGRMTAAELMAQLDSDPEFRAREAARDAVLDDQAAAWARAEQALVHDLKAAGEDVRSVWDLVNTNRSYPKAIPVLLKHLQGSYPERVREGIARALAVPDARVGWPVLMKLFREDTDTRALGVKWAVGCALAAAASDDVANDLFTLLRDRRHGASRAALIEGLGRLRHPSVRTVLMELGDDPDLTHEVQKTLKKIRNRRKG